MLVNCRAFLTQACRPDSARALNDAEDSQEKQAVADLWRTDASPSRQEEERSSSRLCGAPASRSQRADLQLPRPPQPVQRCHDVQALAARHWRQRLAVEKPLLNGEGCLPAGDRWRQGKWIFVEGKWNVSDGGGSFEASWGSWQKYANRLHKSVFLICPRLMPDAWRTTVMPAWLSSETKLGIQLNTHKHIPYRNIYIIFLLPISSFLHRTSFACSSISS